MGRNRRPIPAVLRRGRLPAATNGQRLGARRGSDESTIAVLPTCSAVSRRRHRAGATRSGPGPGELTFTRTPLRLTF